MHNPTGQCESLIGVEIFILNILDLILAGTRTYSLAAVPWCLNQMILHCSLLYLRIRAPRAHVRPHSFF
jgi:hypothetical protein